MKKLILFLMCGILVFSLMACGNKDVDTENTTTPSVNNTVNQETSNPTDTNTTTPTVPDVPENTEPNDSTTTPTSPKDENDSDINDGSNEENVNGGNGVNDNNETEKDNQSENNNVDDAESNNTENDKKEDNITDNKENQNNSANNNNSDVNNSNNDKENNGKTEDSEIAGDTTTVHTPTEIEQLILDLMNQEREKAELAPLTYNTDIYECGVIRANEAMEVWSHTRPDGTKYWTIYEECGKTITNCCGENLAKTFKDPHQIVEMLMNSEAHRKNILYKDFKSVCVVVLLDENGYYYMAQCFMG